MAPRHIVDLDVWAGPCPANSPYPVSNWGLEAVDMRLGRVDQCVACGPGILHLSHQPDEYCRIDHLIDACKVMALAAMRLVGTG